MTGKKLEFSMVITPMTREHWKGAVSTELRRAHGQQLYHIQCTHPEYYWEIHQQLLILEMCKMLNVQVYFCQRVTSVVVGC